MSHNTQRSYIHPTHTLPKHQREFIQSLHKVLITQIAKPDQKRKIRKLHTLKPLIKNRFKYPQQNTRTLNSTTHWRIISHEWSSLRGKEGPTYTDQYINHIDRMNNGMYHFIIYVQRTHWIQQTFKKKVPTKAATEAMCPNYKNCHKQQGTLTLRSVLKCWKLFLPDLEQGRVAHAHLF